MHYSKSVAHICNKTRKSNVNFSKKFRNSQQRPQYRVVNTSHMINIVIVSLCLFKNQYRVHYVAVTNSRQDSLLLNANHIEWNPHILYNPIARIISLSVTTRHITLISIINQYQVSKSLPLLKQIIRFIYPNHVHHHKTSIDI